MENKPAAERECKIMINEPAGTINTGNNMGDRTIEMKEWI
jgi:hypothetical protein